MDILVIQRFRNAPAMMALVATVALGIVLREVIRNGFPNGSNPHPFPRIVSGSLDVGGFTIPTFDLAAMLTALLASPRCSSCSGTHGSAFTSKPCRKIGTRPG